MCHLKLVPVINYYGITVEIQLRGTSLTWVWYEIPKLKIPMAHNPDSLNPEMSKSRIVTIPNAIISTTSKSRIVKILTCHNLEKSKSRHVLIPKDKIPKLLLTNEILILIEFRDFSFRDFVFRDYDISGFFVFGIIKFQDYDVSGF